MSYYYSDWHFVIWNSSKWAPHSQQSFNGQGSIFCALGTQQSIRGSFSKAIETITCVNAKPKTTSTKLKKTNNCSKHWWFHPKRCQNNLWHGQVLASSPTQNHTNTGIHTWFDIQKLEPQNWNPKTWTRVHLLEAPQLMRTWLPICCWTLTVFTILGSPNLKQKNLLLVS